MDFTTIWEFAKPVIAGQVRTALAGVAGSLVLAGAIQPGDEASFVKIGSGIAVYAVPAVWSWWEKVGKVRLLASMAKSPAVVLPNATTGQAVEAAKAAPPKA